MTQGAQRAQEVNGAQRVQSCPNGLLRANPRRKRMPHISLEALALSIITIVIAVIITSAITIIIIIIISMCGRWAPPTSGKQEHKPTIYV
jgi:hypothetical protein